MSNSPEMIAADPPRIIYGYVDNSGTPKSGSGDFTCQKDSDDGIYYVKFASKFTEIPAVNATPVHLLLNASDLDHCDAATLTALDATGFTVVIRKTDTNRADVGFCFSAIGQAS